MNGGVAVRHGDRSTITIFCFKKVIFADNTTRRRMTTQTNTNIKHNNYIFTSNSCSKAGEYVAVASSGRHHKHKNIKKIPNNTTTTVLLPQTIARRRANMFRRFVRPPPPARAPPA